MIERTTSEKPEVESVEQSPGALRRLGGNLLDTPQAFRESLVRHGRPTSDRAASQAVFTNFFLHMARVFYTAAYKKPREFNWVIGMLIFTVNAGWLRNWAPSTPQWVITLVNPGTVMMLVFMIWSLVVVRRTNSTRLGALAMFTCFLIGFVILTYFATVHRGPNWDFYWTTSQWPVH